MKRVRTATPVREVGGGQDNPVTYGDTFRRHRKLMAIPVILGLLGAAFFAFHHRPTYKSTASLWVDTAPPTASSVGATAPPLGSTPAAGEQTLLNELLTTDSFAVAVARNSVLGTHLGASPGVIAANAAAALEAGQITSVASGPQVLQISYTGLSPAAASSIVRAVIAQLESDGAGLAGRHDDGVISYDKGQVAVASRAARAARSEVETYLANHPHATVQSDPNYAALGASQSAANTQLAQATSALDQAMVNHGAGGWMIQTLDQPLLATSSVFGKKKMVEILAGGLFGGALVSFLGVIALTPARKREPWEDELVDTDEPSAGGSRDGMFADELMPAGAGNGAARLSGERRFVSREPEGLVDR